MEYTVEITAYCPHECDYCSTSATRQGEHIDMGDIASFLAGATSQDRINISGGEPLAHPRFWEILQCCRSITNDVWVYTNALDKIRYNAGVVPEITVEANVCLVPGQAAYIPKGASRVRLLQLVPQGRARDMTPANISVSGNICGKCEECNHLVLQANGKIANGPCKKGG